MGTEYTNQTAQVSDTQLFGSSIVHETRFQLYRMAIASNANSPDRSIERYRRTLLFQQLGYSADQIRALGEAPRNLP